MKNTRTFSSFAACKHSETPFLGAPLLDSYRSRSSDALSVHDQEVIFPGLSHHCGRVSQRKAKVVFESLRLS